MVTSSQPTTSDVFARIERDKAGYLDTLLRYLRIPSVSTDPARAGDVRRCAEFLRDRMAEAGLEARLVDTARHPLVYAEWLGRPGAPTVLFYGHYDVQPPEPLEEWRHPPFEPTLEGEQLVARGATDDKGQSFAHLAAVSAHFAERGALPINVKFLIEGEEESGGESIEAYVRQDAGRQLRADFVVVSDSSMFGPGQPSILYGLKGLVYTEIRVRGPERDLHSGTFGGAVQNPLDALAHVLARLRDPETGRVLVPGFYDDVRPLEVWEREEFRKLPFDEPAYRRDLGVPELRGEEGYSTLERVWARPTCDVNGFWGGYQGPGAKTVLPSRCGAKVSMRLVPDQDPQKIAAAFTRFVREVAPKGVAVEVEVFHGAPPFLVEPEGPFVEAALQALEEAWGKRALRVREGGSIPIVTTLREVLGVPVLLLGFGLNDDRLHSPNEKLDLPNFYGGIRVTARLLDLAAAAGAATAAPTARPS
jgi:acetylornithine deacetylase/succinyl-diaminopimelate desuccinylase-like protein